MTVLAIPPTAPAATTKAEDTRVDPKLKAAAEEMEAAFLRQMLAAAKLLGSGGEKGYGSMAAEALAAGIEAGGGLGLARTIEQALSRQHEASAPAGARKSQP